MNKKGIIALIVVIVLVVVGYVVWGKNGSTSVDTTGTNTQTDTSGANKDDYAPVTKESTDTTLLGRLKSASVSASESGARVALSKGAATFDEGNTKGTIVMGDVAIEKTIGSTNYALASISVNAGGAPTYKYVVLFKDAGSSLDDVSYAVVGDRVTVTGLRADAVTDTAGNPLLVVTVSYLDHDKGEPLSAAPTVPRTKILVVENGVFNPAKQIDL
ncbi:MAG TPA: hypothetical protein VIR98_01330 [Candidatus Paceibacterota bacterium]